MGTLTICTPTYNRKELLMRAYNSLCAQTEVDFEWLIIDDGSSDATRALCEHLIKSESRFVIRYVYKENGGKCSAINRALEMASGTWFLVLDSDDFLIADAVEKIKTWIKTIPDNGEFCAIAGRATYGGKEPDAPVLEGPYCDCTFFDRYPRKENHYFFIGHDRPWIFNTEVHRKYLYPIFENERFMTEAVAWNRMAHDGYQVRCFNDIIYTFDHQDEGLTSNSAINFIRNPQGYGLWLWEMARFLNYSPLERLRQIYTFAYDMGSKYSIKELASFIHTNSITISLCKVACQIKH